MATIEAILIGSSTGGPEALMKMMPKLTRLTRLPILLVQHMPVKFTAVLADQLDAVCRHHVCEAMEGDEVLPEYVYVAPGGCHMTIVRGGPGRVLIKLHNGPPRHSCRPAVDCLFESAVSVYQKRMLGVILTGMGRDGTEGARALCECGARVFAQDEASSRIWGMPGSAVKAEVVHKVLSLKDMAPAIANYVKPRA